MGNQHMNADDERAILDAVAVWAEKELRPVAKDYDLADEYPTQVVEQMKELGLFGATISPEYGGLGLSAWTYAQIVMKVSSIWMAPCGIFNSHLIMASAIERAGTEAQKREFLPRMATGAFRGSLGLTEPNAGSDLQAIRTVARRDGDDYVVNGSKTWITNSLHGHGTLLLVKTDPKAEPRHAGMSLLLAEKGPGFVVAGKLKKMGYRAIDSCELGFQDYRVPAGRLLGGVEGKGFVQTAGGLELGRINVAALINDLEIPTIGIGAGKEADGQVLVTHDMLGITKDFKPRFLRRYLELFDAIEGATQRYIADVKSNDFPNDSEQY